VNVIEAFKKAKGQRIKRASRTWDYNYYATESISISDLLKNMYAENLLADDWEIERNTLVWEGEVRWDNAIRSNRFVPYVAGSDNFHEEILRQFNGKRTKIRIEEIVEE